jgi:hypothetical protein
MAYFYHTCYLISQNMCRLAQQKGNQRKNRDHDLKYVSHRGDHFRLVFIKKYNQNQFFLKQNRH